MPQHTSSPRRLVIADDSPEMRSLIRDALESEFHDVLEADNGRDLFWKLLRADFADATGAGEEQVLVTDHYMPGYDGLDVLEAWRELHPRNPTILVTAFPSDAVQARARELGAVMLAKPFSTSTLRKLVREVIHGAAH